MSAKPKRSRGHGAKKALLKESEAFEHYLALGVGRTLKQLRERLVEVVGEKRTPTYTTLRNWQARYCWVVKAVTHDAEVAAGIGEKAKAEQIEKGFSAVMAFREAQEEALAKAKALLKTLNTEELKGDTVRQWLTLVQGAMQLDERVNTLTAEGRNRSGDAAGGGIVDKDLSALSGEELDALWKQELAHERDAGAAQARAGAAQAGGKPH